MGLPFGQIIKILVIFIIILNALMLNSCVQYSRSIDIDSVYALVATDIKADTALCYKLENGAYVGRIDGQVVAVGWDADFIIAERHINGNPLAVEYFILDKRKDSPYADPKESVRGPFNKQAFMVEREKIGVPLSLGFTKRFD